MGCISIWKTVYKWQNIHAFAPAKRPWIETKSRADSDTNPGQIQA